MDVKFSVLISVYYKEIPEYLDLALESITDKQILKPNEIVLVKDGPLTGELDKVIEKYKKKYEKIFKIVALEKNQGLGKALNIGLQECSYNLVARMDGDDISKPERFKVQIERFKKNPELDIVGSWIDEFKTKENKMEIISQRRVPEENNKIYEKLKSVCAFNHPTVIYKKNKVISVGSYNQEFKLEDYYLWVRLAIDKAKMYNIQQSLLYFRITDGTSKRRGGLKLLKNDIKFQKKIKKMGYINNFVFFKNIIFYSIYRIIPSFFRSFFQRCIFRKKIRRKDI